MIKVFINGFGRIGKSAARIISLDNRFELVGINDIYNIDQMKYHFNHDSIYKNIQNVDNVKFHNILDPKDLYLENVDILLECTGIFLSSKECEIYIKNGAKKVIISAPASDNTSAYIYGFNHLEYKNESIISNSSCSANAIVPIFDIIQKEYGITRGAMSMIHSYTAHQKLLDTEHYSKDIRRARSASQNIIPLESSAAKETAKFLPHLKNKLYAKSIRVPISACTFYDLSISLKKKSTIKDIKSTLLKYRSDIIDISKKDLVSTDFIKSPYSAIIDLKLTDLQEGDLLRVCAWQDNEYGYVMRLIDLAGTISND